MWDCGLLSSNFLNTENSEKKSRVDKRCWVKLGLFQMILFYIPLTVIIVACIVLLVLANIKKKDREALRATEFLIKERTERDSLISLFRTVIIILIISFTPALINRVQGFIYPDNPIFVMYVLHGLFTPMAGFFNAISFLIIGMQASSVLFSFFPLTIFHTSLSPSCKKRSTVIEGEIESHKFGDFTKFYDEADKADETLFLVN